jgi:hypothetical protein
MLLTITTRFASDSLTSLDEGATDAANEAI